MLTTFSHRCRNIVLFFAVLSGVTAASFAHAGVTDNCFNYLNSQDYSRAQVEANELLRRNDLERIEQLEAEFCLGSSYHEMGRADDALLAFRKVESLSQSKDELATSYSWLSSLYIETLDFERGNLYAQRAIKLYKVLGDKKGQAAMLGNQASVMSLRGDKKGALKFYQESISLQPDNSTVLVNIASIYDNGSEYEKAAKMFRQAIAVDRRNEDSHAMAMHQIQLGDLLRKQGKMDFAEKELTTGLSSVRLLGDKRSEALACFNFGLLKKAEKKSDESREWYRKAEALYREIGYAMDADAIASLLVEK